jgi:hypothetical protein
VAREDISPETAPSPARAAVVEATAPVDTEVTAAAATEDPPTVPVTTADRAGEQRCLCLSDPS